VSDATGVYLDSSALLRLLLAEGDLSHLLENTERATHLHTSRLTLVECERAFSRKRLEGRAPTSRVAEAENDFRELAPRLLVWEITEEVCRVAARIVPDQSLRTLDAIHLATFHTLRPLDAELRMVTSDRRLALAAGVEPILG
jgi:predicted nucleic acid-binding protein